MDENVLMDNFKKAVERKKIEAKLCECGAKMEYDLTKGIYKCTSCQCEEQDMYGLLREVMEKYPMLNAYDLANLLGIPLRVINAYFENGVLVNPNREFFS